MSKVIDTDLIRLSQFLLERLPLIFASKDDFMVARDIVYEELFEARENGCFDE